MKHYVYKIRHKETGLFYTPPINLRRMHNLSETGKVYATKPKLNVFIKYIHPEDFAKQVYKTPKRSAKDAFEVVRFRLEEDNEQLG